MSNPLFSCVIPVKGDRPFFDEALESLQSQGLGDDLEIIVQDADVEADLGQSDALNKGFAKARGKWFFWLNADDVLLPGALKKVHAVMATKGSDAAWIAGDTIYIDEKGVVLDVRTDAKWRSCFADCLSVWTGGPSAFFRRELWQQRGGFAADLKYAMDIDLWTRWAQAGEKFVGIGDYIWGFRVHSGSQTMNGANTAAQAEELKSICAKHNVKTTGFWRNIVRLASLLDGTWSKRRRDSNRFRGTSVLDLPSQFS